MPKIQYVSKKFTPERLAIINQANAFIFQYQAEGYTLTLRQLYYRFIAKDLFPASWIDEEYNRKHNLAADTKNTVRSYKKLGDIVSDGRRAGLIDWSAIEDRTRNIRTHSAWSSPAQIVAACASQFDVDFWDNQGYRVEVWVEKDALLGVLEPVCDELHVPYFSCRGNVSDSEMWAAAQRLADYDVREGKTPLVIHLGDHDPSGIDMTRDIAKRIAMFSTNKEGVCDVEVRRIALNWDQVEQYDLPPNPAKATDSRYKAYEAKFGDESWELDALDPDVIAALIRDEVRTLIDNDAWLEKEQERDRGRAELARVSAKWDIVSKLK